MPGTKVKVSGNFVVANGDGVAKIELTNDSNRVAFFLRAEIRLPLEKKWFLLTYVSIEMLILKARSSA
jgi:hypothetical protein